MLLSRGYATFGRIALDHYDHESFLDRAGRICDARTLFRTCNICVTSLLAIFKPKHRVSPVSLTRGGQSKVQGASALSSSMTTMQSHTTFQKLALQCHPDKNPEDPNATVRFQKVGQAYNDLNRHFERRDQPSYAPPFGGNAPFGFGSPFGFDAYNAFNMSGRGGGHGPDCSCGMDESDDGYYDDDDDDDDMEFFM